MPGYQKRLRVYPAVLVICTFLIPAGCGGGGGGGGGASSPQLGDSSFYLDEVYYGRPLFDHVGRLVDVKNPRSVIETDPIDGSLLAGYPKPLVAGESLKELASLHLSESPHVPFKPCIVPRNAVLVLEFTRPVKASSLRLGPGGFLQASSPMRVLDDSGASLPLRVEVWGERVVLDPICDGRIGFPASPLAFQQNGTPISSPEGYLKIHVLSAGTAENVVESTASKKLSTRKDLLGSPMKPVGFNPGNASLDFMNYGSMSFNGCLPDVTPPRIIREVGAGGTAGAGSGPLVLTDPGKSFVIEANKGQGEWAGALLTLRPGGPHEETVRVAANAVDALFVEKPGFLIPPEPETDPYVLRRAEYYEPIPGLSDPSTAVDPAGVPKDPFDPEDEKNSDFFRFVRFEEWNPATGAWEPAIYDPGPSGTAPVDPRWRLSLRFSEAMDVESFRTYETFYVCEGGVHIEDPGFGRMKLGRARGSEGWRVISFEPVLDDQTGVQGDRLLGFGGEPKSLRLVIRVIPPLQQLLDFYDSLGDPNTWPPGIVKDLDEEGVLGIINLGGRPLAQPAQFLDKSSPYCVAYTTSPGHGAFPPSTDLSHEFTTRAAGDPEYGVIVHRFMGLPGTGVGPGNDPITGVIYNDHKGLIYGPHIADASIGLNGFLSGHPVEFIEHVFDDYNHPPPSSPTAPDPISKVPFGVGTPINAHYGCRFQHVYRCGDCSPDTQAFGDTILDLIGLSWAPIGGWVTNTLVENMTLVISYSHVIPDTTQEAGNPNNEFSGLGGDLENNAPFDASYMDPVNEPPVMVLGVPNPPAGPDQGVPYVIDWRNLYGPKNQGPKFNPYLPWPPFDQPAGAPGFAYNSLHSLLIEYRIDRNLTSGLSSKNGFAYHAGIISSMLPRFRMYSRGDLGNQVNAASYPQKWPEAWGPLAFPGNYGDNSRYFMIFDYVKRYSLIESPYLGAEGVEKGVLFFTPLILPPLDAIPEGTALGVMFQVNPNPENPGSPTSPWTPQGGVEALNTGTYGDYDFIRFRAVFEANVKAGVVPAIDTLAIPYEISK
jgi:hypothetical protein